MIIDSVRHKGLKLLIERNDVSYIRSDLVRKVKRVILALYSYENMDSFIKNAPSGWRTHRLSGNRMGIWSISVSGNWRITFTEQKNQIEHLNLEDYH